jgi:hypothetical protein
LILRNLKMHRIDLILKQLSELYEFNKKIRSFTIRETGNAGETGGQDSTGPHEPVEPLDIRKEAK